MTKFGFGLDFNVIMFTKEVNPFGIVNLSYGEVKRYDNISAIRFCPIEIEEDLKRNNLVNLIKEHVWQSAFSELIPYKGSFAYKSNTVYGNLSIYHEMNPVGIPNPPRWLIKDQTSWVSAGVWGHRLKNNSPVKSCSELVCISVGDYLVNSVNDEVETFVFSGPVEEIARVADFLDYLGTPSFRFLADPIVLVPSGSSESVFEQEVQKMSEMMDWVSAGEYWMGGAVMQHREDSCECPSCSPELLPDLLVS